MTDKASGWLFHAPLAEQSYLSLDAIFDDFLKSLLVLPDLPYQGAIKLRGTGTHILNQNVLHKHKGSPLD